MPATSNYPDWYSQLGRSLPVPTITGTLKTETADFEVEELLGFELTGDGEHVFLFVEKNELTTQDVVQRLSQFSGIAQAQIGYSGLKDKWAITRQWFSIQLPGRQAQQLDWSRLDEDESIDAGPGIRVLKRELHNRKLRRGAHSENLFRLRLRDLCSLDGSPVDQALVQQRLDAISKAGFPNYFGYQRFGHQFRNIDAAKQMFEHQQRGSRRKMSRSRRSIYLSAARAYCFNELLSRRLQTGRWNTFDGGERLMLNGSASFFQPGPDVADNEIEYRELQGRIESGDLHIGGLLPGEGWSQQLPDLDREAWSHCKDLLDGLEASRTRCEYRPLRAIPIELASDFKSGAGAEDGRPQLTLSFRLQRGQFATALLRELCMIEDASHLKTSPDKTMESTAADPVN